MALNTSDLTYSFWQFDKCVCREIVVSFDRIHLFVLFTVPVFFCFFYWLLRRQEPTIQPLLANTTTWCSVLNPSIPPQRLDCTHRARLIAQHLPMSGFMDKTTFKLVYSMRRKYVFPWSTMVKLWHWIQELLLVVKHGITHSCISSSCPHNVWSSCRVFQTFF